MHPLYFVRSGLIYLGYGSARNLGIGGFDWSGVAAGYTDPTSGSTRAYYLYFNASGVYPSYGPYYRWFPRPPFLSRFGADLL